jgi:predicted kinase
MTSDHSPTLLVFGGLPATGKTTVSRELATRLKATYLRVDAIEQALRRAGLPVGAMGYAIANAIAAENLKLRRTVVADCVNPVLASRAGWRQTAVEHSTRIVEIELICSDPAIHRQRSEGRVADIGGHQLPSWEEIVNHHYEPWDRERLVLDTADSTLDDLVDQVERYVRRSID